VNFEDLTMSDIMKMIMKMIVLKMVEYGWCRDGPVSEWHVRLSIKPWHTPASMSANGARL